MRVPRLVPVLALLAGLAAAGLAPAPAAAVISLSVAPALVELEATPGGAGTQSLTVSNGGDKPIDLAIAVEPYKTAVGPLSAVDWLSVEPTSLRLAPDEDQEVTVAIAVPDDLEAGGRYAAVSFTTGASAAGGTGAAMAGKIGIPFFVAVDGEGGLTRRAELERFAPVLTHDGRVAFAALLVNSGNLHLRPAGAIEILNADGSPLGRLDFQQTTAILPGTRELLVSQGSVPLPPGPTYRAVAKLEYGDGESLAADVEFRPEPLLSLSAASVCENLDRGPTVRLGLRNDGGLGLQPRVQIGVWGATGNPIGSGLPTASLLVWPGEGLDVAIDVPERLASGEYRLSVRVDAAPPDLEGRTVLPPVEQEFPFRVGGLGGDAIPLCAA
jgi:hypothetical protein